MKVRLMGTEAECAKVAMLLKFASPQLLVVEQSPPYPNRGDSLQVRVYLEVQFPDGLAPVDRTFYSLTGPDGQPLLVDAWGTPAAAAKAGR